jgi:hypothetical protein
LMVERIRFKKGTGSESSRCLSFLKLAEALAGHRALANQHVLVDRPNPPAKP